MMLCPKKKKIERNIKVYMGDMGIKRSRKDQQKKG